MTAEATEPSTRGKILVIDDDAGPRESIMFVFDQTHDVFLAESVDQGIGLLQQKSPDVVIMDIRMPEKDGIQGLHEIRGIDPDVSVLMLILFLMVSMRCSFVVE